MKTLGIVLASIIAMHTVRYALQYCIAFIQLLQLTVRWTVTSDHPLVHHTSRIQVGLMRGNARVVRPPYIEQAAGHATLQ
jgi:hypothetical protein